MYGKLSVTLLLAMFVAGCASPGFPPQTGMETQKIPADKRIEISLASGSYDITEVEFHVDKTALPDHILKAAAAAMPNGEIGDCEIEYHGGDVYYEVTAQMSDHEEEVMFTSDGEPYRWEVEVGIDTVPLATQNAARGAVKGGKIKKAEQILDGKRDLLEHHFKIELDGVKYKVVIDKEGVLLQVFRETIGEIEVPITFPGK